MARCIACDEQWDHCHDALITHGDGATECAGNSGCAYADETHVHVEWCADLRPPCTCAA